MVVERALELVHLDSELDFVGRGGLRALPVLVQPINFKRFDGVPNLVVRERTAIENAAVPEDAPTATAHAGDGGPIHLPATDGALGAAVLRLPILLPGFHNGPAGFLF